MHTKKGNKPVPSLGNTSRSQSISRNQDVVDTIMPEASGAAGGGRRQRGRESLENELRSLNTFYQWGTLRSPRSSSSSKPRGEDKSSNPPESVTKRSRRRRKRGNLNLYDNRSGVADLESSWQEAADAAVAGLGGGSGWGGGRDGSTSPIARWVLATAQLLAVGVKCQESLFRESIHRNSGNAAFQTPTNSLHQYVRDRSSEYLSRATKALQVQQYVRT